MILITDITVHTVPSRGMTVTTSAAQPILSIEDRPAPIVEKTEYVHGQTYQDSHGRSAVIGMTSEVRELLGMPLDAMNHQASLLEEAQSALQIARGELTMVRSDLDRTRSANFWTRLRWLFTGIRRV